MEVTVLFTYKDIEKLYEQDQFHEALRQAEESWPLLALCRTAESGLTCIYAFLSARALSDLEGSLVADRQTAVSPGGDSSTRLLTKLWHARALTTLTIAGSRYGLAVLVMHDALEAARSSPDTAALIMDEMGLMLSSAPPDPTAPTLHVIRLYHERRGLFLASKAFWAEACAELEAALALASEQGDQRGIAKVKGELAACVFHRADREDDAVRMLREVIVQASGDGSHGPFPIVREKAERNLSAISLAQRELVRP